MKQPDKQTAIYCRTASHEDFGFVLDCQKLQLVRYAKEHGYTNPVIYMDNGFSGLTLDRPAFSKMQQGIREGEISTVLVKDISRIGRSYTDVIRWVLETEQAGIEVVIINIPGFPDTMLVAATKGGEPR